MTEWFLAILPHLYSSIAIISMIGYVPQIYRLTKSTSLANDISLTTWWIWFSTWIISLLYGAFILKDWRLCMIAIVNLIGHMGVIGLTSYNRYFQYSKTREKV